MNKDTGKIDLGKGVLMLLSYPIKEELVFRIIIYQIFLNRSNRKIFSSVLANFLFASIHLLNAFSGFSLSYVFFQSCFCFIVGFFYSLRFVDTDSPFEGLVLHMINNFTASFLPSVTSIDIFDPFIFTQCKNTLSFFFFFIFLHIFFASGSNVSFLLLDLLLHLQQLEKKSKMKKNNDLLFYLFKFIFVS